MPVMNSQLMRQAMERAKALNLLVISHSEDIRLASGGAVNEGDVSRKMGVNGIPDIAETIGVMRDIAIAEFTGARLHVAHVSTAGSVRAIRDAKARGVSVTAETAPHYLTLTDADVLTYGTHAKMNPPLRSERDRDAVRSGLVDGTIDAIATDHAPHAAAEKAVAFADAPNGIIGLETSLAVSLSLVRDRLLTLPQLIEKMSVNPARILGIDNRLAVGRPADITIIDPRKTCRIDARAFRSKARNTPFDQWEVAGRAVMTMAAGNIVFEVDG
jgi:dihydroorotase